MKFSKFFVLIMIAAAFTLSCASSGGGTSSTAPAAGGDAAAAGPAFKWDFSDTSVEAGGWKTAPDEYWDFKGTMAVKIDETTMGKPMLRVDVDYSKDSGSWWSEPKLKYEFAEPFELKGIKRLSFEMYYNPANSSKGSFKGKLIFFNNKATNAESELDAIIAKEQVGDYMKANVSFRFSSSRPTTHVVLGIVGAVTDYNGPIFIDNMRLE